MIDEIYEVTQKDYQTRFHELKQDCYDKIVNYDEHGFQVDIYSKDSARHFLSCEGCEDDEGNVDVKYYIIDMPLPEERKATPIVRRIELNDEESAREFLEVLAASRRGNN